MKTIHRLLALPLASLGLLVACGSDGDGTGPNPGITVVGFVQDRVGEPISDASVLLLGKPPVRSDANGRFSIPGVRTPYDIAVIVSSQKRVILYKNLTRSDPNLAFFGFTGAVRSATISGTAPPASGVATFVFFIGSRYVWGATFADPTTGQYAMTVPWQGSATAHAGRLYLLRFWRGPTGLPASYDGYGSKPLTIGAGGEFSGNDFAATELIDPPEQTISGSIAVPVGYTLYSRTLVLFFAGVPVSGIELGPLPSLFTYTVPDLEGVVFGAAAEARDPCCRRSVFSKIGITGNSANVILRLEPAALLTLPTDGTEGVDITTAFRWNQGGGTGVNTFNVIPGDSANPRFTVVTTDADATIPNLAGEGMGLPAAVGYRWSVTRTFSVTSADDAAGGGFLQLIDWGGGDVGQTFSEGLRFTTRAAAGMALQGSAAGPRTATAAQRFHMHGLTLQPRAIPMDAP
jgi:hypothetical protein